MYPTIQKRLHRLEFIQARSKSGEPVTVGELAEELGVSVRTINRDIEVLREQGLPIEADRGRGGGIRLHRNWGIGRVNFTDAEAIDLLITLAIAEQMQSPLFMANLKSLRHKMLASFSPAMKTKISQLKSRILIGGSASVNVLSHFSSATLGITKILHQAFVFQNSVKIHYQAEDGAKTQREIQTHYLLLNYPVWYILAWDQLRQDIRTFRCDRINKIVLLESEFRLLPLDRFAISLEGVEVI